MTHGFLRCQQSHPARFESWFCFGRNCPYCSRRGRKFNAVVPLLVPLKRIKLFKTKTPKSPIKVLKPRTGLFCFCLFCFAKQARTRGKPHFCPRFAVLFVYPPPPLSREQETHRPLEHSQGSTPRGRCENAGNSAMGSAAHPRLKSGHI